MIFCFMGGKEKRQSRFQRLRATTQLSHGSRLFPWRCLKMGRHVLSSLSSSFFFFWRLQLTRELHEEVEKNDCDNKRSAGDEELHRGDGVAGGL